MFSLRPAALAFLLLSGCAGSTNRCLNVVCDNNRVCDRTNGACYAADAGIGIP